MSEKIQIICSVFDVTPQELLGGTDEIGSESNPSEYILITKDSEYGRVLMQFPEQEWRKECGPISRVYAIIVGDTERREGGIISMCVEGTRWSPKIMSRNS